MRIVEVTWEDASSTEGWMPPDEADGYHEREYICVTVGYLVKRDKRGVTLSATVNCTGARGGTWHIPAGMIRRVRSLGSTAFKETMA